jgi:hypothetical protein
MDNRVPWLIKYQQILTIAIGNFTLLYYSDGKIGSISKCYTVLTVMKRPLGVAGTIKARLDELNLTPFAAVKKASPPLKRTFIYELVQGKKKSVTATYMAQVAQALQWTTEQLQAVLDGGSPDEKRAPKGRPVEFGELDPARLTEFLTGLFQEAFGVDENVCRAFASSLLLGMRRQAGTPETSTPHTDYNQGKSSAQVLASLDRRPRRNH